VKRIIIFFLLLFEIFFGFHQSWGQQIKEFTADTSKYIEELNLFMGKNITEENQLVLNNFLDLWRSGAYTDEERNHIISISNLLLKRKARAIPHFRNYLLSLIEIKKSNLDPDNYNAWIEGLVNIIDKKGSRIKTINQVLQVTYWILSDSTLYKSSSTRWKAVSGDYRFVFDTEFKIIFNKTDLICYAQNDSGIIYQTKGEFIPDQIHWKGRNGIVTWERAGYKRDEVFATLNRYEIDMTRSRYSADSVSFTNIFYFNEPVMGFLEEAIKVTPSPQRATYPQFSTYTKRFFIKDLYENIDFDGGLKMNGAVMNGSGSELENAILSLYHNDTLFFKISSSSFAFSSNRVTSRHTSASIYLGNDSIFHPNIAFNYNTETKEVTLYRTDDILTRGPYFNSYHSLDMNFEQLIWRTDEPVIKFTSIKGSALSEARFQSTNYFNQNHFYQIQAMDEFHPLYLLKKFAEWYYSETFPVEELAKWMGKPDHQIIALCVRLSNDGFIYYNKNNREITLKQRLFDYLDAYAGKIDYDVVDFISNTTAPLENASLDLETFNLAINGIPRIFLSDSQNVFIYPKGNKINMRKNRYFNFDGTIQAGLFTFFGNNFVFDYDSFKINLYDIDSLRISVQSGLVDEYGRHFLENIENIIEMVTGELLIDEPYNKSGLTSLPEYPIFNSNEDSYVFYEKAASIDSSYKKDDFYFKLDPYTIYNLDKFIKEDINFEGEFYSGNIFPTIRQNLIVKEDNSLGFSHSTPEEGFLIYGGKGIFYNNIEMSNMGLEGSGKLNYLTSTTISDNFKFFPDSMMADAGEFTIDEDAEREYFPFVESKNVQVKWYPKEEEWYAYGSSEYFTIYDKNTRLNGSLKYEPGKLTGSGKINMPNATITSEYYELDNDKLKTDTSDFKLKSLTSEGYVFVADNVSANIDFSNYKGLFSSNDDSSNVLFPDIQYVSTMDYFDWNMEENSLAMEEKTGQDRESSAGFDSSDSDYALLETPDFMSTNPRQDSLGFDAGSAIYNVREDLITAYNVPFIEVADALIFPDSSKVELEKRSRIRTLQNAKIEANRVHSIHSAEVNILNKNDYKASGKYNYIDEENSTQFILFDNISVNKEGHTTALGEITESDSFMLSPYFGYIGKVQLDAEEEFLTFNGGVCLDHNCDILGRKYLRFTSEINSLEVLIPVTTQPNDINGQKIFNGHFITNDSIHIYSTFLSNRKTYSDNLIIPAEGFLYFNKESGEYRISSKEKLTNGYLPGNLLSFDKNYCRLFGEGTINLAVDFGQFKITPVGQINHNIETNEAELDMLLGLNFFFSPEATTLMANEINAIPTLPAVDMASSIYNKGITEIIGFEKAKELNEEASLYGRISQLPPQLQFTIFITHLNLAWNQETRSYRSVGKIGIGSIFNTQLNVLVDGHLEIQKKRSGDLFDLYLKMDNNTWYYFGYSRGVMQSISSNRDFNALLMELGTNQRKLNVKSGETPYIYMVAVDQKLNRFLRRFSNQEEENNSNIENE
jgi:hypothetical protein